MCAPFLVIVTCIIIVTRTACGEEINKQFVLVKSTTNKDENITLLSTLYPIQHVTHFDTKLPLSQKLT